MLLFSGKLDCVHKSVTGPFPVTNREIHCTFSSFKGSKESCMKLCQS